MELTDCQIIFIMITMTSSGPLDECNRALSNYILFGFIHI